SPKRLNFSFNRESFVGAPEQNGSFFDIDSGLWGGHCKSSSIAKENCALKCLSPTCYELIYESDPLEEGEKDYIRGKEFKYCMYNTICIRIRDLLSRDKQAGPPLFKPERNFTSQI
ncbi:uncharacterized protein LOC120120456, partial [Hibiscus syriacus]|uniref:uncharacterized protein LOC120120456 n=1 Tax=Hibiscus syriacus TaxID=106335 RepID=UPI0019249D15